VSPRAWVVALFLLGGVAGAAAADPGSSAAAPEAAVPRDSLSTIPALRDTLRLGPGERVVCLRRPFVLLSTLEVREEGRVLRRGEDYVLDPDAGCLTLMDADTLGIGRRLVAAYRALPMALQGVYRLREDPHRRRQAEAPEPERDHPRPVAFADAATGAGLTVSGSKTFGIEVGNRRDLKLRQSLDLRLTGRVSHDVTLLAMLSDQDVPFQPEGNTAELEELDKVLVQLESPRAGASLGDVSLQVTGFDFLDLRRELEGFTGEARLDAGHARGAVASAKGEFATREFFGLDGKQGPYPLTDRGDSAGVVVVAGSERIWIDGELLARGAEEDYVVDYALGEITFTSRRVITANTEISVDYQFATSRYRRRLMFGGVESADLGRAGRLRAAFFVEEDDADRPFGGDLSDAERGELAAVGDSARVFGGTRFVGSGEEDYDLVVDAETGRDIFVFVEGTGDYKVTFVNVGDGRGEYDPDPETSVADRTVYMFVGEGRGSFLPRRDLPAPERRQMGDLRWDLSGAGGRLTVEGALSETDGNTLSNLDDGDNQGGAFVAAGELAPVAVGGAMTVTPKFRLRRVGDQFRSPTRLRPAFFSRDWNLTGVEEIRDEDLREGELDVRWGEELRLRSEVGQLALADSFTAVRQRPTLSWSTGWSTGAAAWTTTRDEVGAQSGRLDRKTGDLVLRRWAVWPRVRGLHETRRRSVSGGERHREWEAGLVFPAASWPLEAEFGAGRRLDDSLRVIDGAWREARETRSAFGTLQGEIRSVSFLARYEARRVTSDGAGAERRDVGRLDLRQRAIRGAWTAVANMSVGTVGLRRRSKSIVEADSSSVGYYDRFGNYVGAGGGYDVVYGARGEETLTGQVELVTRLRWFPPGEDLPVPGWLRKVAWEGYLNLNESSTLPLVTPRYFLSPGSYLDRETTLDGRLNQRQTVDLFPLSRSVGLKLRQEATRRMTQSPSFGEATLVEMQSETGGVAGYASRGS